MNGSTIKKVNKMITQKRLDEGFISIKSLSNYVVGGGTTNIEKIGLSFYGAEEAVQEMYLKNFKKIVSGKWNEKTHAPEFKRTTLDGSEDENKGYNLVNGLFEAKSDEEELAFVQSIHDQLELSDQKLLTIIRANVALDDEEFDYGSFDHVFVTLNDLKFPDPELKYKEGEIKLNTSMIPNIRLTTPQWGFMYPSLDGPSHNVNSIIFYVKSLKLGEERDLLQDIFDIDLYVKDEEKQLFTSLVKSVVGNKVNTSLLEDIYRELHVMLFEEEEFGEPALVGRIEVQNILRNVGYPDAVISEEKFSEIMGNKTELPVNLIMDKKKIDIKLGESSVKIDPLSLGSLESITKDGKEYVLLHIEDDVNIEGFEIETKEY